MLQALRLQFLRCREEWLGELIADLEPGSAYEYLKRLTDVHRLHMFDVVMQYRAIFSDESTGQVCCPRKHCLARTALPEPVLVCQDLRLHSFHLAGACFALQEGQRGYVAILGQLSVQNATLCDWSDLLAAFHFSSGQEASHALGPSIARARTCAGLFQLLFCMKLTRPALICRRARRGTVAWCTAGLSTACASTWGSCGSTCRASVRGARRPAV